MKEWHATQADRCSNPYSRGDTHEQHFDVVDFG